MIAGMATVDLFEVIQFLAVRVANHIELSEVNCGKFELWYLSFIGTILILLFLFKSSTKHRGGIEEFCSTMF